MAGPATGYVLLDSAICYVLVEPGAPTAKGRPFLVRDFFEKDMLCCGGYVMSKRTPQTWDEESFADEIGRRHGSAARDAVEKLVNWAERKERELAATTDVCTKVLTRFPTNGCTAEPELMFPVDLNLEPRGSQPTISIHADGTVVVWLGAMRHPPFDTESARHELRRGVNELDGVHLPSRQVTGWPRFPLTALEDTANLVRLVAVLDRIATESHTVRPIEGARPELAGELAATLELTSPTTTGV